MADELQELIAFRHRLHTLPETSNHETETARTIAGALEATAPDELVTGLGGHGLAAVYHGGAGDGPTVLVRAELDALPIAETGTVDYRSRHEGQGHMCGHDGHMTILLGLARRIAAERARLTGRVVVLYQPAEETAEGARRILDDERFRPLRPDWAFALHNLPGFPAGQVLLRRGVFASASKGLVVRLRGMTSHAAHPENGRSPAQAMTQLMDGLAATAGSVTPFESAALITLIHARLGEIAFGTAPGEAEVMATLRAHDDTDMAAMASRAIRLAEGLARVHELDHEIEWVEVFPATVNHDDGVERIAAAAEAAGLTVAWPEEPFPWSEDFGWFLQEFPGALCGLGSGTDHPQLHNSDYDFPDRIIPAGIDLFQHIVHGVSAAR